MALPVQLQDGVNFSLPVEMEFRRPSPGFTPLRAQVST